LKLLSRQEQQLVFVLTRREQAQLLNVLQLYPRIPPAHYRLSKSGRLPEPEESQKLLDEALAEVRASNRKTLQAFLSEPTRFTASAKTLQFTLSETEAEWLLQVLNDVRVGSWVSAGSPENFLAALNEKTTADIWAMEIAGYFEAHLLDALSNS